MHTWSEFSGRASIHGAWFAGVLLLGGCDGEHPTSATPIDVARRTATGVTGIDLGTLPGDNTSRAFDVNSDGIAVGSSGIKFGDMRPFAVTASGPIMLPISGTAGVAYGISDGPSPYVVGREEGPPGAAVRWRLGASVTREVLGPGLANDVNSSGAAAGSSGGSVAIWSPGGDLVLVPTPAGDYFDGSASGINEDGFIVSNYWRANVSGDHFDPFVRAPDGRVVKLPPADGDFSARGTAISNVVAGRLYVSGQSTSMAGANRAVRWEVDAASLATAAPVAVTSGVATGVSDDGEIGGTQASKTVLNGGAPFFWSAGTLQLLKLPRRASDGIVDAIGSRAGSPTYASGVMQVGNYSRAVMWRIP